jgi:hypothetical protein
VVTIPPGGNWHDRSDLIVFLAVLTAGAILVLFGHVATGGLTSICTALVTLYGAWKRSR